MLMYPEDKVILLGTMWSLVENKDGCYLQLSLGHGVIIVGLFDVGDEEGTIRASIAEYIKAAAAMMGGKRHA